VECKQERCWLAIVLQRPCGYNPTSNPPRPFLFLPLFKESCDPLIRRLENTTRQ
jgi:hypothetical protein